MKTITYATSIFLISFFAAHCASAALPDGYVELRAIQGDVAGAYIATGYIPKPNIDRVEAKFRIDVRTDANSTLFCSRIVTTTAINAWTVFSNLKTFGMRFDYLNNQDNFKTGFTNRQMVELSVSSNVVTFADGSTLVSGNPYDPDFTEAGSQMFLFGSNQDASTAVSNWGKDILYSFKVYRSGELIHDYVPAKRSSDGKIGLYDVVDDVFFTNASPYGSFKAYYNHPFYLKGNDSSGSANSMAGGTGCVGWTNSVGVTHTAATSYEDYVVDNGYILRSAVGAANYAFAGDSLTVANGRIGHELEAGYTLTIGDLRVPEGGSCILTKGGSSRNLAWGGNYSIAERGSLTFQLFDDKTNSISASVSGSGILRFEVYADNRGSRFLDVLSGDLSAFTGSIEICRPSILEFASAASIPGNPPAGTTSSVVVTNGSSLIVDQDWTSSANRVWDFGDGAKPTLYVAEGKTVTIKGDLRGSAGFLKRGLGTLVLSGSVSNFSGTCEVLSGKVVLKGGAADLKHRCFRAKNAMVLPSGYTMLDYLHLSGGGADSYIDTGFTPTTGTFGFLFDYYIDKELVAGVGANTRVMGSGTAFGKGIMLGIAVTDLSADSGNLAFGQTNVKVASSASGGQVGYSRMRMSIVRGEAELSRGWRYSFAGDASTYYGSVYLGTFHTQSPAAGAPLRIYRFKVFEGLTLVNDFVPVRTSGGAVGLYDTYGNLGFRQAAAAQYVSAGPAYSGSDKEWIEVQPGFAVYVH